MLQPETNWPPRENRGMCNFLENWLPTALGDTFTSPPPSLNEHTGLIKLPQAGPQHLDGSSWNFWIIKTRRRHWEQQGVRRKCGMVTNGSVSSRTFRLKPTSGSGSLTELRPDSDPRTSATGCFTQLTWWLLMMVSVWSSSPWQKQRIFSEGCKLLCRDPSKLRAPQCESKDTSFVTLLTFISPRAFKVCLCNYCGNRLIYWGHLFEIICQY